MAESSSGSGPSASQSQEQGKNGSSKEPGRVVVNKEAAERALERTLTQTGALLVPPGQFEIEPGFSYTRRERTQPL
ncbi:MAG TPA: hypothetical protein VKA48_09140, partial [Gammaproteobacteria bacterium]|nr:hypothetical protein [Gammaproteobacteria bacterium]